LLQSFEDIAIKEINNCDAKPVAQLFHRRNRSAVVSSACNVVDRGLRYPADGAKFIYGDIPFTAKLNDTLLHSIAYRHRITAYALFRPLFTGDVFGNIR